MANSDKNIVITPNRGLAEIPDITFTGFGNTSISVKVPDGSTGSIAIESDQNTLFSVDSNVSSGGLLSITDQSNQPSFEVNSDGNATITVQESVHIGGKGLVLPRYDTTSLPVPEEGMLIYDNTVKIPKMYDGKQWVNLGIPDLSIPPNATLVTNSLVDGVFSTGMTTNTNGDVNGSYVYQGTADLGGCGNPNSAVFIRLKDTIPWRYITCYFEMVGTAACWSFMGGGVNGNSGGGEVTPPNDSIISGGNLEPYNPYEGDRIFGGANAFDGNPRYTLKLSACDNSSDNFFHPSFAINGAGYKSFWVTSRRKPNGRLSGPFHHRSCNTTGQYIRISNIYIY